MDPPHNRIEYKIMGRIHFHDDRMPIDFLYHTNMEEKILDLRHSFKMASQILPGWNGVKVEAMILSNCKLKIENHCL